LSRPRIKLNGRHRTQNQMAIRARLRPDTAKKGLILYYPLSRPILKESVRTEEETER